MALKPGLMGSRDTIGKPPDFAGSLADVMEIELNRLLREDGLPEMPAEGNYPETRDRRRLFVAIARAVIRHLDEQRSSIAIPVHYDFGVWSGTITAHPAFCIEGKTIDGVDWPS